jgi:superfamily II DNA or RNA helicase
MPVTFSADDLGRVFEARTLTRGRTLVLIGAVEVSLSGDTVKGQVSDGGVTRTTSVTPRMGGRRVEFGNKCSCGQPGCAHLAATALAGLDRYPALRRAEQKTFLDNLTASPAQERQRLVFDVSRAQPPHACSVAAALVGERTGRLQPITPAQIGADPVHGEATRAVARMMGGGDQARVDVPSNALVSALNVLIKSGQARWASTAKRLVAGEERVFDANVPPPLPAKSGVLLGDSGPWYVDGATGQVGRVRLRQAPPAPVAIRPKPGRKEPAVVLELESDRVMVERTATPVVRLRKLPGPDEFGRQVLLNTLTLGFDYGGGIADSDDERQFVRCLGPTGPSFVRRDPDNEAAVAESLRQDGFVQLRIADPRSVKGRRVFVFRDRDSSEQWHRFLTERITALQAQGWRCEVDADFGPRFAETVGLYDAQVSDAGPGRFSLELGIEIDGVRHALLPILARLHERGGIDAAQIVGDDLITSLDDGRVLKLPAERIRRLLSVMGDLIEAAGQAGDSALVLPQGEAVAVLELEDLLTTRWQDAASIAATVERFREQAEIPETTLPATFTADLRPYQQHGVNWLQNLSSMGLSGFLADEMGLGKTAQTIAHITVEQAAGRLVNPVLIVVPTSLIANWTAELHKFAPHLRLVVLHGQGRDQRREQLDQVQVVITTYTVLARDIEPMKARPWHMVVLDEAQAIKSPDAKATRAVCQLETAHRLCLSGTPIENNLDELWSQFAFLMPGLLGDRRGFTKRFRTPIEKKGDDLRRMQLVRRIAPFILRRTKSEVATELPPKHTILRRVTLAADQRELYETIRSTLLDTVREQVAQTSLAKSRFVVLNALLKLRQACCDPRLVKLAAAQKGLTSSKLDTLLEMVGEMLPEGRRILIFSQFTSMLDLIKPALTEAGHKYVELRGDTTDRAEPVRSFEAGEVPLFLISLKAGGRGLNLTSADTVIHYDPWWNPAAEDQASDRAHRIGQTKSVFVYKLIAADTVEERILDLQARKADLANIALNAAGETGGFDAADVDFLFGAEPEREAA